MVLSRIPEPLSKVLAVVYVMVVHLYHVTKPVGLQFFNPSNEHVLHISFVVKLLSDFFICYLVFPTDI